MASDDPRPSLSGFARNDSVDRVTFSDPTGRRWRVVRLGLMITIALAVGGLAIVLPQVSSPPALEPGVAYPPITADEVGRAPLFGTGPLLRVVRVESRNGKAVAVDPFADAPLHALTAADNKVVGASTYAIERYGYSASTTRTMSLTFDDGPDPKYTPTLLDLLSRERVPATFCIMGRNAAKYPGIVDRIVREGHALCNHSYSHPDLGAVSALQAREEMILTDRILRVTGGMRVDYLRPPYNGADDLSVQDSVQSVLRAQQWGYQIANYDFDTADWEHALDRTTIPMPELTGANLTVLLHDAGGRRENSLAYAKKLIDAARTRGYTFHTMPQVNPELAAATSKVTPTAWDRVTFWGAVVISSWSGQLLRGLLFLAVFLVAAIGLLNVCLAVGRRLRRRRRTPAFDAGPEAPLVSVVIAAYNEEKVIERTIVTLRQSTYSNLDILIIDDGSVDRTAEIVDRLALEDSRVRLLRQANAGKPAALNYGFEQARGDIVVTGDADTLFSPQAIGHLVKHFAEPGAERLAAVAGVVKVGNVRNLLTRWQALEYLTQVGIERSAQAAMGAIMTVPGACAAWSRTAILAVGGFSDTTLAEDCDLALTLQRRGYRVAQDEDAIAYTEAPETMSALLRQRLRWTFGNLQALWKHRGMLLRPKYGLLGLMVLPFSALSLATSVAFMPFIYLMVILGLRAQGGGAVITYLLLFMGVHLIFAIVGVVLMKERPSHLLILPLYRPIQEPLRAYLVYKSIVTALRGARLGWNKLQRTGTVAADPARSTVVSPVVVPSPVTKRERYLDVLRAIALIRIVFYHTLSVAWFSLVYPSMGIMFGLAGSLMARSLDRSTGGVIGSRLRRLLPALWLLAVIWVPLMLWHGWSSTGDLARPLQWQELLYWIFPIVDPPSSDWGGDVSQVLWYLRTYVWFVLLSPLALAAFRRWPVRTMLVPLVAIALTAVGLLGLQDGLVNTAVLDVATFGACWLLGFAHHDGMIRRAKRSTLTFLAVPALAVGGWWAFSQAGTVGTYDLNDIPFAQAMWSFGFVLLLLRFSPKLGWLDRIPPARKLVEVLNSRAVTIYLWHEVAIMLSVSALIYVSIDNSALQLAIIWALVGVAVLAFGWVEDLAARRGPQLVPGVPLALPRIPVPRLGLIRARVVWALAPRRSVPVAASVIAVAAAYLVVSTVITPPQLEGGAAANLPTSTVGPVDAGAERRAAAFRTAAVRWIDRNVPAGSRVVAGEVMMKNLVSAGFSAAYLIPFDLVDTVFSATDKRTVVAGDYGAGGYDYVISTRGTRASPNPSPATKQRLQIAPAIATFGDGQERVEIRLVLPKTGTPGAEVATADAAALQEAGAELATNEGLELSAEARATLLAGEVDSRLLSVLSLLTAEHTLHVASFAVESGEEGARIPRRSVRITAVDGRPVENAADVARLQAILALQGATFRPAEAGLLPAGNAPAFEVRYTAPSPMGLLPTA